MEFIDVAYSPKQISCPSTSSPSPRKPGWVIQDWQTLNLPIRIVEPIPVTREELSLAHDREYVDGVLDCRLPNGFRGRERDVAESLLWTVGSFLTASRMGMPLVWNLAGGYQTPSVGIRLSSRCANKATRTSPVALQRVDLKRCSYL